MIRKLQAFSSVRGAAFAVGVFVAALINIAGEKTASAQAPAVNFGDRGQLVITAENLFGFTLERIGTDQANDNETSDTLSNFGLFHRTTNFRGPWVGAHYFVIPNLSLGATLGFVTTGGSHTETVRGTSVTGDLSSSFTFIVLPKVGYYLALTNMLGFWFRGGLGYWRTSTSNPNNDSGTARGFGFLSVDALFTVTPVQYFGFYVGPQGNLSFAGSYAVTDNQNRTVSWDSTFRSFSIDAGILGYFDL